MKHLAWPLALLVLLLPAATAEPAPETQRAFLIQNETGMEISERYDWTLADGVAYEPVAHAFVPSEAAQVVVTFNTANATDQPRTLAASAIQRAIGTVFDTLTINLTSVQATAAPGAQYTVSVTYQRAGPQAVLKAYYPVAQFTVRAVAIDDGYEAGSPDMMLAATSAVEYHGGRQNLAAGDETEVSFAAKAGAPLQSDNMTKWAWGISGLILGLLVMFVAVKQGWLKGGTGPKFVKGGAMESKAMLEARRRTLMAALKELEQAREANQVPNDAYGPLKEEYKAQAVRVMRSLEEKKE